MPSLVDQLFAPFTDKKVCIFYLAMSVIWFILLCMSLVAEVYFAITKFNTLTPRIVLAGLTIPFQCLFVYFTMRLLYSMCAKSIH